MADQRYQVVVNHEEQYSIIPAQEPPRRGWRAVGKAGSKEACLKHIEEVWTDMGPADRARLRDLVRRL